ncbi:MAG: O-antigen ligase family protein [Lachnospiraceae bacterium]|nr:O-antigen ligase family protein [Lachnospiraceae bacterium]
MKLNKFIFIGVLILCGGFYDWNVALIGAFLCLSALLLNYGKQGGYKKEKRWILWIPELIFGFQIAVSLWAVDRSANTAGIVRGIVILLWMHICLQWDSDIRLQMLRMIPDMGGAMVILSVIASFFDKTKHLFWRAERLGGFFQYANTCALFLLLGIIIHSFEWESKKGKKNQKEWWLGIGKITALIIGILLTGSRSILIIGILWGIIHSICHKSFRKVFICMIAGVGVLAGLYYAFTGEGTQNISRIFTVMNSNSTLYGRILYDIDGISILLRHPMGLGYLGYHYVQHAFQTGVYTVRFVHNDMLQIGLDYGVIPMILSVIYMAWQIMRGNQTKGEKTVLAVTMAASLVDFHMQYMMIDFIIVLCLDQGVRSKRHKRDERIENGIGFIAMLFGFIYCFIPYYAVYKGMYHMALQFIPDHTEALCMAMEKTDDKNTAYAYADRILQQNLYVTEAYNVKAYAAAMDGNVESVMENQDKVLRLEKYDIERYRNYDLLLEQMELQCRDVENEQIVVQIQEKRTNIREQLKGVQEHTNPIAYKLRDVPEYTW